MGRQPSKKNAIPATELLNFHFTAPAPSIPTNNNHHHHHQHQYRNHSNGSSNNNNNNNNNNSYHYNKKKQQQQQYYRTAQDRASARKRANSTHFYLHSSPDHSFAITRRVNSKVNTTLNATKSSTTNTSTTTTTTTHGEMYTFSGVDAPVSWEAVRIVQQWIPILSKKSQQQQQQDNDDNDDDQLSCPICLDAYVCPRITKCGHSFCLSCLLHHVQSYAAANPYAAVKCPCCAIPLFVEDLRPVIFKRSIPPTVHRRIRLLKLHRQKKCSAPYLPIPNQPKHSNSHSAPCQTDLDARFSHFTYVDPIFYSNLLSQNVLELQQQQQQHASSSSSSSSSSTDMIFLTMSLEIVAQQQLEASKEFEEESRLQERFANPASGMYQKQPPCAHQQPQQTVSFHSDAFVLSSNNANSWMQETGSWDATPNHADNSSVAAAVANETQVSSSPIHSTKLIVEGRSRGNSIASYSSQQQQQQQDQDHQQTLSPVYNNTTPNVEGGSFYLEDESDTVHFYQSEDGQLVFLNGFNMACLLADFAKTNPYYPSAPCLENGKGIPNTEQQQQQQWQSQPPSSSSSLSPPFPDAIEGKIVETESMPLTPALRKRMPFLDHLPLYTEITLVELDLSHIMSDKAKQKFKGDLIKRKKRRMSKIQAEKREDRKAKQEEERIINERKARLQRIDPEDEFFHPHHSMVVTSPVIMSGEGFGPAVGRSNNQGGDVVTPNGLTTTTTTTTTRSTSQVPPSQSASIATTPTLNFSQAIRRAENRRVVVSQQDEAFPSLSSLADAFPTLSALGSSPHTTKGTTTPVKGNAAGTATTTTMNKPTAPMPPMSKKKKGGKGQKIVLFSTGGQRNC